MKTNMKKFEINDRVIQFMKQKGLDELQVATAVGKNPSTIYRITNKTTVPTRTTLKSIADAYGIDVSFFMGGNMQIVANAKAVDSPWKEEAYARLKSELEYLKGKYDQLFEAFLKSSPGKLKDKRLAA